MVVEWWWNGGMSGGMVVCGAELLSDGMVVVS